MTCEQCGADAVDAGVCRNCGWRAISSPSGPSSPLGDGDDAARLAETREADIPVRPRRPVTARNIGPPTPYPAARGNAAPPTPRPALRTGPANPSRPYGAPGPSTNRFCGTCGAQIEAGQMFCGQCGAAVASFEGSAVNLPTATNRPPYSSPRYPQVDDEVWSPADRDAPTEQWEPAYGRGAIYQAHGALTPALPAAGMSREVRLFLGILCVFGALVSGAGAILLAFVK